MPWAPDYVDASDLADFVRVNADNPYVGTYGTAAARAVDTYCNRQFGRLDVAAAFTYPAAGAVWLPDECRYLVLVDDVPDTTGLVVSVDGDAQAADVDGYQMWPRNAAAKGVPYLGITLATRPSGDISVTSRFGWLATPAGVTGAVWLQVNRWNIRRESPYGTAGAPGEGSEMKLSAVLDPDVRTMLAGGQLVRKRMPR